MDSKVYDENATLGLSYEKQNIVLRLSDMFFGYSLIYIRGICEACLWDMDMCIDKLISYEANVKKQNQPQQMNDKVLNFSKTLKQTSGGAVPKVISMTPFTEGFLDLPSEYTHIYNNISKGYKVLVIMRGAPGSGKSYLSKTVVRRLMPGHDFKEFVLSADDYFFDARGRYRYNVQKLDDAHNYCQTRAREKMQLGYSPIFIDNTNQTLWEMMPYVKAAVEYGYMIELMEPVTPWRNKAGQLALKNVHGVPKQKIQRMLDRFEVGTPNDLLALLKDTSYTTPPPQMRVFPPYVEKQEENSSPRPEPKKQTHVPQLNSNDTQFVANEVEIEQDPVTFKDSKNLWPNFEPLEKLLALSVSPKKQNKDENSEEINSAKPLNPDAPCFYGASPSPTIKSKEYESDTEMMPAQLLPPVPTVWKSYEQEATNFWGVPVNTAPAPTTSEPMALDDNNANNCGLLQLLKEGVKSINVPNKPKHPTEEESVQLVRHRVGCENENQSFLALRQIYPNKPNAELWDLFVKCNGSIDWAVDILIKDEDSIAGQSTSHERIEECDDFDCCCGRIDISPPTLTASISQTEVNIKPQRSKPPRNRGAPPSAQILEAKEAVEKSFVLGDEHYSSHVKKIRNKRNITEEPNSKKVLIDVQVQTEEADDESEEGGEASEVIEVNLGKDLIQQLSQIFISETPSALLEEPEKYKSNVFMPKTMARELYVLFMESVYNQQEEQRQSLLKEDEEFARLLKNPKYENLKQPPENIKELLDMEYAWMIYKTEQEQYNGLASKHPTDLASHLTRMKLCEIFPNIPRETLLDILAAHNNKFSDTVEVLQNSMQTETVDPQVTTEDLIEKVIHENEKLSAEEDQQEQKITNQHSAQKMHSKLQELSNRQRSLSPEEAKRMALSEFEETRNYAAHHSQLRAECYQKAKEAIQRGNSGVAVYYSQIANLHKRKIDIYNHRAANCIMEVHDLTQNNPDFIDLHYLHVVEAVACLDIFVDRHIAKLRSIFRSFKYVFIITGRGLHSTGGVSMIKTRVKSRLKERNLKWSEVNPGLLKVKIFSASKYSKNL